MIGTELDGFLQAVIGPRETRDPLTRDKQVVLRDVVGTMEEIHVSMSNCDGDIDEDMDKELRARPVGVIPSKFRTTDWLSPRALYDSHEQTVELYFRRSDNK
jgi:hypothetical protein